MDKEVIEKNSENHVGFELHRKYDHNLWNYIYLISYLNWRPKTDLSGIE